MNFDRMLARALALGALSAALAVAGCGASPAARTVSSSDTTSQTAAGAQTRTTVNESTERGANGSSVSERTETVRTSTPAPATPRQ